MTTSLNRITRTPTIPKPKKFLMGKTSRDSAQWGVDYLGNLMDRKIEVGDRIEVLDYDGSKYPELVGQHGEITSVGTGGRIMIRLDSGGDYKSCDLWWRRLEGRVTWTDTKTT